MEHSGESFAKELEQLLNKHSVENNSGTPDFLLAGYLVGCLAVYEEITRQRDAWHGGEP